MLVSGVDTEALSAMVIPRGYGLGKAKPEAFYSG